MPVDLLITQCHALIITNQEIWERCKPFNCTTNTSADSQQEKYTFYGIGYVNIKASSSLHVKDCVTFESTLEVTKSSFKIPISLPKRLECFVSPARCQPAKNDIIPDYELFLRRSMLLVDEVLIGFLLKFKTFLEDQQIALGKVDAWLLQADEDALFLQNQFNVNIPCDRANRQNVGSRFSSWETSRQVLASFECSRCRVAFQYHTYNEPDGWVSCKSGKQTGCFPVPSGIMALGRYECPGKVDVKFCMEIPSERNRLIRFLEFARNSEAPIA